MSDLDRELSAMVEETGEHVTENYLDMFFEIFDDLKIGPYYPPVPLEVLQGIALAFANASGYRVILQADIMEPVEGEPDTYRTVGHEGSWLPSRGFVGSVPRLQQNRFSVVVEELLLSFREGSNVHDCVRFYPHSPPVTAPGNGSEAHH